MTKSGSRSGRRPESKAGLDPEGPPGCRRAVGIGELLWDLLPGGPRLGGAPFNVIAHLRRLGFGTAYVSSVGFDDLGRRALARVRQLGVATGLVGILDRPTGTVRVDIDEAGIPSFEIVSPAAYEELAPSVSTESAGSADVLIFGTLAQRFDDLRRATRSLVGANPGSMRVYDVNLRPGCWTPALVEELIGDATILKLNEDEMRVLGPELSLRYRSIEGFAAAAIERYGLRGVCVTRGSDGAALLWDGRYAEAKAVPVRVVDTVGAGDAFTAGLVAALLDGLPAERALDLPTSLAGLVASRNGATPYWQLSELGGLERPPRKSAGGPSLQPSLPPRPDGHPLPTGALPDRRGERPLQVLTRRKEDT